MKRTNIAVFASGTGSNLQALIDAERREGLSGGIVGLVISDNPGAFALKRVENSGIPSFVLDKKTVSSVLEYDKIIVKKLKEFEIDLVVLAGFMKILSGYFIEEYRNRILNIHPSLLPSFKGAHGISDAFDAGVKVTGVTVHFVTEELDSGPIILQEQVIVKEKDDLDALEMRIHKTEHRLYPEAVRLFCKNKLKIEGNKVKIIGKK